MGLNNKFLDKKRNEGDLEADQLVEVLFKTQQQHQLYQTFQMSNNEVEHFLPELKDFYQSIRDDHEKYDLQKVEAGQRFYRNYAMEIMMLLGAMSLPYCYAAAPGNKALFLTEKIRKRTGKRLFDTAEYVIQMMEPGCLAKGGSGYFLINKTRLIHALVRYHLKREKVWKEEWGIPINQEDMAGTNLAFSFIILKGLKKQRFPISEDEINNFLYTWKYIGFLMHIDEKLLVGNYDEAESLEEIIKKRTFSESEEGKLLMQDLLVHYRQSFPHVASWLVDSQIRYFLGKEVSQMLGLRFNWVKDPLTYLINKGAQVYNRMSEHEPTYQIMINDHEKSRTRFGI